ncbi:MAG: aldehyde dehydrogenase family protein [Nitrospinae bacterium]|nr:aldehyde dehydrogenase family protein [Nitrospinota bacterium]
MQTAVEDSGTESATTVDALGFSPSAEIVAASPDVPITVIEARSGWRLLDLKELYAYRDLFRFLIWRSIKVRYAQSAIGIGWAIIQPLFSMIEFVAERFLAEVRELDVIGGGERQHLVAELTPNWASITMSSDPPGAEVLVGGSRPADMPRGYFYTPTVVANVTPTMRLHTEEIFGPVLTLFRARDFDEALELANASPYRLTGGVYSRDPAHLEAARRSFRVGNLYINRPITGALVGRQPFGGFGMSGVGSKAGGPDYLLQFLEPVTISENTIRRGFAPTPQPEDSASGRLRDV